MSSEKYILVIGAAHIDVFANYQGVVSSKIDKPGSIIFSLGGTAFNIVSNLAFDNQKARLLTVINPSNISGLCILSSLEARKINSEFVVKNRKLPEGAFVAFRQEGELVSAVTQTSIENLNLENDFLTNAIRNASVIVADCNLSKTQITQVISHCCEHKKPILLAGVSESKAERIKNFPRHLEIDVFSANYKEIAHLLKSYIEIHDFFAANREEIDKIETWSDTTIREICSKLRVKYLIVTKGQEGYLVLSKSGTRYLFPAGRVTDTFVSSTGAGDALLAGVALHFHQSNNIYGWEPDWPNCNNIIQRYVDQVLCIESASPVNLTGVESPLSYVEQQLAQAKDTQESPWYQKYIFSFLVVLSLSSLLLGFLNKLTAPLVGLLSLVIFATLLVFRLISEKAFLTVFPNINSKEKS